MVYWISKIHAFSIYLFIPYISNTYELDVYTRRYYNDSIDNTNIFFNVTNLTSTSTMVLQEYQCYFPNVTSLTVTSLYIEDSSYIPRTEHIEYLRMVVNLFHLQHLDIHIQDKKIEKESCSVLLEILKETPKLISLSIDSCNLPQFIKMMNYANI